MFLNQNPPLVSPKHNHTPHIVTHYRFARSSRLPLWKRTKLPQEGCLLSPSYRHVGTHLLASCVLPRILIYLLLPLTVPSILHRALSKQHGLQSVALRTAHCCETDPRPRFLPEQIHAFFYRYFYVHCQLRRQRR